ncbi:MAG: calcium/sodium antiporter [Verrucomicrobia subdivision 3 bacterium]|nr:calcium/sodium antiporter [Limisphaerales bacterium]
MLMHILLLLVGLALLAKGGELFVAAAVRLAEFLRMPRVVIGSTLVSLATTTPELVVSIMAGAKGAPELAVGNAVGSCICNVGLVLGLTAAFKHIDVNPAALRIPLIAMFTFGATLMLMTLDLGLSRRQGMTLICGGAVYFVYDFVKYARDVKPSHIAEAAVIEAAATSRLDWFRGKPGTTVQFLLGAGTVVLGSRVLVDAAVALASALGLPSILIGLTIVAVGTSLPELITAVTSSRQAVSDLAVGNVLGANIANLTIIVGTAAVLSEVTMRRVTHSFNFLALLGLFAVLLWMLLSERRVSRKEGVTLVVLYNLYIAGLVLLSAALK